MRNEKNFSIIIPTKNRKEYLREAIESILNQNEKNMEIIIIDDNSTDGTANMIKEYCNKYDNFIYIKNDKNLFAHHSRKRGYNYATGKYIIFMDDDDFYIDNDFFCDAKKIMEEDKSISTVIASTIDFKKNKFGKSINLNGNGKILNKDYLNKFEIHYNKPSSTLTMIIKKDFLIKMNLENSKMVNDTCIYLNAVFNGNVYLINKSVAAYRIHENNISNKKFKFNFIIDCLNEKNRIYKLGIKEKKIIDPKYWYYKQIRKSVYYFIYSSNKDFCTICLILCWILFHNHGTLKLFIKDFINYLK